MKKSFPVFIRFNDLDVYGHVNNAVYLTYFEEGRNLYFKDIVGQDWDWNRQGLILARNEIDYKALLKLRDRAQITLWISKVGHKSLEVSYEISKWVEGNWTLCTLGKSILVCIDYATGQTVEVPAEWKEALKRAEDD